VPTSCLTMDTLVDLTDRQEPRFYASEAVGGFQRRYP